MQKNTPIISLDISGLSRKVHLFIFVLVTFFVFILPPLSAFIPSYPDILRPESIFLLVFLVTRLICSRKLVKFSLEYFFLLAMFLMVTSIAWAASGLGIHTIPQDFADIYSFFVYWAVFRYGYELARRYQDGFIHVVTVVFFIVIVMQFTLVLGQRMNISDIINISSWWSHDYDASPWLRVTRPHGMSANAITLSILMALFFTYFFGQALSKSNFKIGIWISLTGLILCFFIIILTKSRTGFVLLVFIPLIFSVASRKTLYTVLGSSAKFFGVLLIVAGLLFGITRLSGYQGKFVLVTATTELVSRIGNFIREGVNEKEGAVGRIKDAELAFSQLKESPLVGIGLAQSLGKAWFHSSYITLLRRYGIIGMVAYLAPYLFALLQFSRYVYGSGAINLLPLVGVCLVFSILIGGVTNYTFIGEWQINYFFWLMTGTVIAMQHVRSNTKPCCM